MNQKRNRSLNWDDEEKQLLRAVMKEYTHIIENKSLDSNTNKKKAEAWEELHKKFNELNVRPKQLSQLKIQWKTMKINARKSFSSYKTEVHKTGGGARPATPDEIILEIKDLLNPAELLRDHNIYDSDGIIPSSPADQATSEVSNLIQQGSSSETSTLQDSKSITCKVDALDTSCTNNNFNKENQQIADSCIEIMENVDNQKFTPIVILQDDVITATPIKKKLGTIQTKKVPKRKILSSNITDSGLKSRKDHNDYISSMISHSKMLKDEEHKRRMEMAEKEHAITMAIQEEKLKSAILEREILEIKKSVKRKINFILLYTMFGCKLTLYYFV